MLELRAGDAIKINNVGVWEVINSNVGGSE